MPKLTIKTVFLILISLFAVFFFSACNAKPHYNFICQNTMSISILSNGKNHYFSIPVQYVGDYQIESFEFLNGYVLIGDYKILLERENIKINISLNKSADEYFHAKGELEPVYSEDKGKIKLSKLDEPIIKDETDKTFNLYNIDIERILTKEEIKNIINEYENLKNINYEYRTGNTNSKINIEYKIKIENEFETGMFDYFEFSVNSG
jgi:hypothetical protein